MVTISAQELKGELAGGRAGLIDSALAGTLDSQGLRSAMTELYDLVLGRLATRAGIVPGSGYALCAFGGLGRREMLPYSDLDLVLLYDGGRAANLQETADALWYPLWDSGLSIDHSVRTPEQCLTLAAEDPKVALSMLELRHIAGDPALYEKAASGARTAWRKVVHSKLDDLVDQIAARRQRSGAIAHRTEPDLKYGEGGLRDAQILDALAAANVANEAIAVIPDAPGRSAREARNLLLDVRTCLHLVGGKSRDILHAQFAEDVARLLHYDDRFALARDLSNASRTIAFATDLGVRTARGAIPRRGLAALRRAPARRPLAEGVVEQGGEVVLARGARPERDDSLLLRVATASARHGIPISAGTLRRLADGAPSLRDESSPVYLDNLVSLLGTGELAIGVIETLDRSGLWDRILPEWAAVRDLPSRSAMHVFTVDRHQVEVVAEATRLATEVSRPDLLLICALIHDIGKGRQRDHSVLGAELAAVICARLGMPARDAERVVKVVRHHLLLAKTAASRDASDPATAEEILTRLGTRDRVTFELLVALTEADSRATGPGVWTPWKAHVHSTLAATCVPYVDNVAPAPPELTPADGPSVTANIRITEGAYATRYVLEAEVDGGTGRLADVLLVLAARGIEVVRAQTLRVEQGEAGEIHRVLADISTLFGTPSDPALVAQDLRALSSSTVRSRLHSKVDRRQQEAWTAAGARPRVWFEHDIGEAGGSESRSGLLRVRSADRPGLLAELIGACRAAGVEVEWSRAETFGEFIADTLYVSGISDAPGGTERLVDAVRAMLPSPPPEAEENR